MSSKEKNQDIHNDILKDLGVQPSEFDGVSTSELTAEEKRLDVEIKRLELQERQETQATRLRKKTEAKAEFDRKMQAIRAELGRRAALQRGCSHKKGGTVTQKGFLPNEGGDADVYALLKHQLPNGDWWIQCQRCAAEWLPANKFTGQPETVIGGFSWRDAFMARTDNSPSKSAVFNFEDHRSAEQIEADRWRAPRDEQGNEVEDVLAKPLHAAFSQPPSPVRLAR